MYVAARLRLTELSQTVVDAFYREEIGVGHALLLAKLPVDQHIARGTGISPDTLAGVDGETRNALNQIQRRAELAARKVGGIIDGHITGGGGCGNGRHRSGQGGEKGRERY